MRGRRGGIGFFVKKQYPLVFTVIATSGVKIMSFRENLKTEAP
jgi:hypothetical protein